MRGPLAANLQQMPTRVPRQLPSLPSNGAAVPASIWRDHDGRNIPGAISDRRAGCRQHRSGRLAVSPRSHWPECAFVVDFCFDRRDMPAGIHLALQCISRRWVIGACSCRDSHRHRVLLGVSKSAAAAAAAEIGIVPSDIPPVRRRDTSCVEGQSLTLQLLLGGGVLRLRQGQLFRVNNGLVNGRPRRAEIGEFRLGAVALQNIDR
jgi:hypothetical protein